MNYFAITCLLTSILSFSLGSFVFIRDRRSKVNNSWFLLSVSIAVWSLGYFLSIVVTNHNLALFFARVLYFGSIFIPITFFHFICAFLDKIEKKRKLLFIGYISAFLFSISDFTPLLIRDVKPKLTFNYYSVPGPLYIPMLIMFFVYVIYSHILMIKSRKELKGYKLNQLYYIFIASSLAFSGGATSYPLIYDIQIYPFGNFLLLFYPIIITIAIVRYRLMDIEVIIRETAIFAGIFGFSVGIFVLAIMAGQQALQPYIGNKEWLIPAVALLIVTFAVRPIEGLVYNTVGRFLFKKRQRYHKTLQDAAAGMSTIRNPKKLLELITHILSMKMKLDNISILIYDDKLKQYRLKASRGRKQPEYLYTSINENDPLVSWFKEKKEPVVLDEAQRWIRDEQSKPKSSILISELVHIEEKIRSLNASLCVPSFYREELLGILALGDKKSGDFFSQDDIDLFKALADEAAIAIKNSQLYFEIDKKAKEIEALYQREHKLFMHSSIAFAAAIDARDPYTHGHSERVTNYGLAMLDYIGHSPEIAADPTFQQKLRIASVLHDIGKIGISDDILHKPAKLDAREITEMEKHPAIGAEIVSRIKGLRNIVGAIRHHHERYDGKGYPDKLKSNEIPLMARIIAVADSYDAMTSDRPYRKAMSGKAVKEEIIKNASTQFDPYMVAAFLKALEEGKMSRSYNKEKK